MKVQYTLKCSQVCAISALTQIRGRLLSGLNEGVNGALLVEYDITSDQKPMLDSLLKQEGYIIKDKSQWPSDGDKYYYLDNYGDVYCDHWKTVCDDRPTAADADRRDIGNVFKTEEEARFERERLKVLNQLKRLSDDDQVWDGINLHYHIIYDKVADMFEVHMNSYLILSHGYWFKSGESADAAIKAIGKDNLKKYVFNVKE